MRITMVKKRLLDGRPCDKCAQSEEMLRRRGLWHAIDDVVWAQEGDDASEGALLAQRHGVKIAPFFLVETEPGQQPAVVKSALKLVRDYLQQPATSAHGGPAISPAELSEVADRLATSEPSEILRWALERFGEGLALEFSGGSDVALIDMAARLGLPHSVFMLDTGRLHPETYSYVDEVRRHYGIAIEVHFPDAERLAALVREKGQHSFLRDGHGECCAVRREAPRVHALSQRDAWVTADRADARPATAPALPVVQPDPQWAGRGDVLVRVNPLARLTGDQLWDYIHDHEVPYNPLHARGFRAIACEPCTRPIHAGQVEADGLWWWENESPDESGPPPDPGAGI